MENDLVQSFVSSFMWEYIGNNVIQDHICIPSIEKAKKASSRREVDKQVQWLRREHQKIVNNQNNVMITRERLKMLFDIWNSEVIEQAFHLKAWKIESVPKNHLSNFKKEMDEATDSIRKSLYNRFTKKKILPFLEPDDDLRPFAINIFNSLISSNGV